MIVYHLGYQEANIRSENLLTGHMFVRYTLKNEQKFCSMRRLTKMFDKIFKSDALYVVAFALALGFLYFSLIISG